MLGVISKLVFDRWKRQDSRDDAFQSALTEHREATEKAMKEFRGEFMGHLERLRSSNETAFQQLNSTMAQVAKTAGEIRARMAERYATKEDLSALEGRVKERFKLCSETCPARKD